MQEQKNDTYIHDDKPMTHEQRIAVIGQSPESLQWFINYHQYYGWLKGYTECREDYLLNHAPPF